MDEKGFVRGADSHDCEEVPCYAICELLSQVSQYHGSKSKGLRTRGPVG